MVTQTDKAKAKKPRRKPAIAEVKEEAVGISPEAPQDLPPTEPQTGPPDVKHEDDAEAEDEPLSDSDPEAEAALEADMEQLKTSRKKKQSLGDDEKGSRPPARLACAPSASTLDAKYSIQEFPDHSFLVGSLLQMKDDSVAEIFQTLEQCALTCCVSVAYVHLPLALARMSEVKHFVLSLRQLQLLSVDSQDDSQRD